MKEKGYQMAKVWGKTTIDVLLLWQVKESEEVQHKSHFQVRRKLKKTNQEECGKLKELIQMLREVVVSERASKGSRRFAGSELEVST